jgi:hypothetical protein
MRNRIAAIIMAFAIALGFGLVNSGVALANSPAQERIYNDTSNGVIGGRFHTSWGTWADINVGPFSWQGEGNGNYSYEPRYVNVGALWCMNYHYKWADTPYWATSTACGGSNGYWMSIRPTAGDSNTVNMNFHVTAVWYRGY